MAQLATDRLEVSLKIFDQDLLSAEELGEVCQDIIVDRDSKNITVPVKGNNGRGTVEIAFLKSSQKQMINIKESRVIKMMLTRMNLCCNYHKGYFVLGRHPTDPTYSK